MFSAERLFAALYIGEVWYNAWETKRCGIHARARAVVLFDRVLNGRLQGTAPVKGEVKC